MIEKYAGRGKIIDKGHQLEEDMSLSERNTR